MLSCFDTILESDKQTDRQTNRSISRVSTAVLMRDKNATNVTQYIPDRDIG